MNNLHIKIKPNHHNKHGYHVVLYKPCLIFLSCEVGRFETMQSFETFMTTYNKYNNKQYSIKWLN